MDVRYLKQVISKLGNVIEVGITPKTDLWLAGKIRLVNMMCLVNFVLVLGMVVVDLLVSRTHYLSLIAGFVGLVMLLPYYLNYRQRDISARVVFLTLAYISICALAIIFGKAFLFQYYLVPGVGMSLIFFRHEIGNKKWIFTFAGIPLWMFLEFWFVHYSPLIVIESGYMGFISYFSAFLIFVTAIVMFATFTRESDRHLEGIHAVNTQLRDMANRDPLTGLNNRRFMADNMALIFKLARQDNRFLALAMFDMDHFKRINDTYGHDAGDKVLQTVSRLAKENLRETDLLARIGGEEFCILFTSGDRQKIRQVIERLRTAIMNHPLPYGEVSIDMTASFGVAWFTPELGDYEDLFKQADHALYQAKESGRNRLCEYQPETA